MRDEGLSLEQKLDSIFLFCRLIIEHHVLDLLQGTLHKDFFLPTEVNLYL